MQLRYNYRLSPTPSQRLALARAFGCARVVFNDGLRARQEAHEAGLPYIKDTELQKQVITAAKRTQERAWLGEVSSVVLVQSLRDLHTAYRNFFASVSGKRRGPKTQPPRFKSKRDRRQPISTDGKRLQPARQRPLVYRKGRRPAGDVVTAASCTSDLGHCLPGRGRPLLGLVRHRYRPRHPPADRERGGDRPWTGALCGALRRPQYVGLRDPSEPPPCRWRRVQPGTWIPSAPASRRPAASPAPSSTGTGQSA